MPHSSNTRAYHRFNAQRFAFALRRLSDEEYRQLRSQSFPIQFSSLFLLRLALDQRHGQHKLNLAKVLLILEDEFGRSSTFLDTWKQTFLFPFLLTIEKSAESYSYLLRIEDYRGRLEFRLYRVVDDLKYVDQDMGVFHSPIADELTEDDIQYLISYLWGFLEAHAQTIDLLHPEIQPFFRHVDSSHVVYGYWDGKFIQEVIEDPEEYQQRVQALEQQYGQAALSEAEQVSRIRTLIESICSNSI